MPSPSRVSGSNIAIASPPSPRIAELAELLALGYLRCRARQAAQEARAKRREASEKPLDDVAPEATLVPGERRTSETEESTWAPGS